MEKIVEDILNCLCLEWDENIENIIEELKLKELYKTTESMGLCYSAVITDIITDFLDLYIAKIEMDVAGVRKMDMKGLVSRCDKDIFYSMVGRMDEEEDDDEPDISASSVYYNVILSQSITKRYYLYDCLRLIAEKMG